MSNLGYNVVNEQRGEEVLRAQCSLCLQNALNTIILCAYSDPNVSRSLRLRHFSASLRKLHAEKYHENHWSCTIYRAF